MADNLVVTPGSGATIIMDELTDPTFGTGKVQLIKLMDGTPDGTTKAVVSARGLAVDIAPTALSIAKAEDAASADGDVGVMALGIRKATPANTSGADGDYETFQINAGRVWTDTRLGDGTVNFTIKAASTAPVATDTAIVVALSPNGLNVNGQASMANSAPVALASDQGPIPAGLSSDRIYVGGVACTPKFAVIDTTASGQTPLVAAVAAKKIRVVAANLICGGIVNVRFQSASTSLTGAYPLIANTGIVLPFNPAGHFETAVNTVLNINLSAGQQVSGCLTYIEV
jgi:hypothetical protein